MSNKEIDPIQYCAPNVNNGLDINSHYTCFDEDELREIAKTYNSFIQKDNICHLNKCVTGSTIEDIEKKDRKQLWKDIYERLMVLCRYEWCWLNLDFINEIEDENMRNKIHYFTFKPKMTETRYAWLSNKDIDYVIKQYEKTNKNFKYIGAHPSDYFEITEWNISQFKNPQLIGIVFNLDTHKESGSHWVCFVVDNANKTMEYFDSAGQAPTKYIKVFIKKLLKSKEFKDYTFKRNKKVHQKENSECGVYCINFMIERLNGKSFEEISDNIIGDNLMNNMRDLFFRPI